MLEEVLKYERGAFFGLNGSNSVTMDNFMWLISNKFVWIPLIISLLIALFYKKNWKEALLVILMIVIVITICDQVCSSIFKPVFHRFRPTHHPDFMDEVKTVFGYKGGLYGFASSHASNAFGVAMFTSLLFRVRIFTVSIFCFAFLNAYSRVYLGVHFISDVVVGALVGIIAGILCYKLYLLGRKHILRIPEIELKKTIYTKFDAKFLSAVFFFTLIILLLFNNQLVTAFH